ncbi:MAG: NACHT domain-containing protein [Chloroflexota bacterium]
MSEPVSLEGIYTDVFTLDKIAAFRRFDIQSFFDEKDDKKNKKDWNKKERAKKERKSQFQFPSLSPSLKRKNAFEVISKISKLFILGKPGAGKTTLLKFIALKSSEGKINRIPIFISLKEWSDSGLDLNTFIVKQFEICSFPESRLFIETILNDGKSIVLFDGLDEVNQENQQRIKLVTSLKNFIDQYDKNQFLITCRIAASDYSFENFSYVEIADFNADQIKTFAGKWFSKNPTKKNKFLTEIESKDNEGLKELASIPLLLTLLCLAFDETMAFPQRRVEIYEEAIEALLKKWDTSRNIKRDDIYRKLSLGRKRQLLARIAAETFENSEYFIHQERLANKIGEYLSNLPPSDTREDIDGQIVLKSLEAQHGLLVERAWKIYSFSHLTFHEYFTAKYIAENSTTGTLHGLATHIEDNRWREVLLLTTSLLDNADSFFEILTRSIHRKASQHESLSALLSSSDLKTIDNHALIDYPSRARFLEQDIVRYLNSENRPGFSPAFQKHLQNINYARSCALELAIKHKIQKSLLLVLSLDLILLARMLNSENARNQYSLHYPSSIEEADDEITDASPKTKEEMDFIFSKDEMKSIIKAEKGLLEKKDTSLTSCIGSLYSG